MTYRESAWEAMPKEEREALEALVELAGDRERAMELAGTIARKRRKARLDAASDRGARVLVGARVPRREAEEIRHYAKDQGMSLYSFIREALQDAMW